MTILKGNYLGAHSPQSNNNHTMKYIEVFTDAIMKSGIEKLDISDSMLLGDTNRKYSGLAYMCKHFIAKKGLLFKCNWNGIHSQACAIIAGNILPTSFLVELDLSDNMCGLDPIGNR